MRHSILGNILVMENPGFGKNLQYKDEKILYCLHDASQSPMKSRILLLAALSCCAAAAAADEALKLEMNGALENRKIDEASGLQAGEGGVFYTHNDQKRDVFVIDATGRHLGEFKLDGAKNRDWEDITRVPHRDGHLLMIAPAGSIQQ